MRGKRLLEFTHPDDHARATEEAMRVFRGERLRGAGDAGQGEGRQLALAADQLGLRAARRALVYARSTDVTERKASQEEREALIGEVEMLARSDALTGLPNRRALDDQLPREMARALRAGDVAMPGDHRHRPLQGLQRHPRPPRRRRGAARLRRRLGLASCAAKTRSSASVARSSWSSCPNCEPADATEIVERLRAATPGRPDLLGGAGAVAGRGRASMSWSRGPTRPCTRPRRRARPARRRWR